MLTCSVSPLDIFLQASINEDIIKKYGQIIFAFICINILVYISFYKRKTPFPINRKHFVNTQNIRLEGVTKKLIPFEFEGLKF